jgi:hypothetical protein
MVIRPRQVVNCPHCGAVNPAYASTCEACSRGLVVYIGPAQTIPRRFGLGSIMVLVASVAFGLGLLRAAPPLGVVVLLLVPAALVRTVAAMSQRASDERPMTADERASTFAASLGVVLAVIAASALALAIVGMPAASMAMSAGPTGRVVAFSLAGLSGLGAGYWVLRKLWPYRG